MRSQLIYVDLREGFDHAVDLLWFHTHDLLA